MGKVRTVSTTRGRNYEQDLAFIARLHWKIPPLSGPLRLDLTFHLQKTKGVPKGRIWPCVRPDLDNYTKAFLDAVQGIVFKDDGQICGGEVWKKYSKYDYSYIEAIFSRL